MNSGIINTEDSRPNTTVGIVVDTGTEISMFQINKVSGTVSVEHIRKEPEIAPSDDVFMIRTPEEIREIVIRIPVLRDDNGVYYTHRHLRNSD